MSTTVRPTDLLEQASGLAESLSNAELREQMKLLLSQRKYHAGILACRQGILESAGRATERAWQDIARLQQLRDMLERLLLLNP